MTSEHCDEPDSIKHWSVLDMSSSSVHNMICVAVAGQEYQCQKLVLYCHTDFFRSSLHLSRIDLPLMQVAPHAFSFIYNWMLMQSPHIPLRDHIVQVFRAASYLRVLPIVSQCWQCLNNVNYYNEHDAVLMLAEAQLLGITTLTLTLFKRMSKTFLSFVATDQFLNLSIGDVYLLLSQNVGVNVEVEVLMVIGYWLTRDWDRRKRNINRLLRCVRFNLLPLDYLSSFCLGRPINWITSQLCSEQARRLACSTVNKIMHPSVDVEKYLPKQRKWIYDQHCPYHHQQIFIQHTDLNYDQFIAYLTELRSRNVPYYMNFELKPVLPFEHPLLGKTCEESLDFFGFSDVSGSESGSESDDSIP